MTESWHDSDGDGTDEAAADYAYIAQDLLGRLLGRRLSYGPQPYVEEFAVPSTGLVFLTKRPVRSIESVTDQNGTVLDPSRYALRSKTHLRLTRDTVLELRKAVDAKITVDYVFGANPTAAVRKAVDQLAVELRRGATGDPECGLPERVTTVNRQGVSWTLIDPQDFLQDGRTGLYFVDLVLKSYNAEGARTRARVFSPEHRPGKSV